MAPLAASFSGVKLAYVRHDETHVYKALFDPEWTIGPALHGGYLLGVIVTAANLHQYEQPAGAPLDVVHLTAHYLRPPDVGSCDVEVKATKKGRGYWHISAQVVQKQQVYLAVHSIYGTLVQEGTSSVPSTAPAYAIKCPLVTAPSRSTPCPTYEVFNFNNRIQWSEDLVIKAGRPEAIAKRQTIECGSWFTLTSEEDNIYGSSAYVAYLADMFFNTPELIDERLSSMWLPTMVISIELVSKIPQSQTQFAPRTAGLFSTGHFILPPDGRHDINLQVWTAPASEEEGWQDHQRCLARMTQMALSVPFKRAKPQGKL